ncbi:MAG: F0F1 ATP synthase subunit delta [Candidatus Omnitrophota bacterium]
MLIKLIIIQILTFAGLIFLLRYIFSKHLNVAVKRLDALHEENLVKEAQLKEELKRAQEERKAEVERGKEEAAALLESAKKEAMKFRSKMEQDAKAGAERIIAQGELDVKELREKLVKEMEKKSLDLAINMIKTVFTAKNKEDLQSQFIGDIIEEIGRLPKEKFTVTADKAKIISCFPLQTDQRNGLKKVLQEKLGHIITMDEKVDEELISGLIIEMGGLVIDGTLRNRFYKVLRPS